MLWDDDYVLRSWKLTLIVLGAGAVACGVSVMSVVLSGRSGCGSWVAH